MNTLEELTTPAFVVDRTRFVRNCDAMRAKASAAGVAFRPHVKTHKTVEGALLQHGGIAGPVTVSTLREAEVLAAERFTEITYAVPIAPSKLDRAAAVSRIAKLSLLVDSVDAVQALEAFHSASGVQFPVFLKVDCGYHRAGVDPDSEYALELAKMLASSDAIAFAGLLTHAGHSYGTSDAREREAIAREEGLALTRFRERIGMPSLVRSTGSTPTATVASPFENTDEVRPGNYVYFDRTQSTLGSCSIEECAATVLATVVGSYPDRNRVIVDAGALALSKDRGIEDQHGTTYGLVCDMDMQPLDVRLSMLSQEHGEVDCPSREAAARLAVGTRVRIIPNHSCLTAANFDLHFVAEGHALVDQWRPARGW